MRDRFTNLKVVEIKLKKTGDKTNVLTSLAQVTDAFRPESCARQVYIFFAIRDEGEFSRTLDTLKEKSTNLNYFTDFDAYQFLLSWIVGAEYREYNPKYSVPLFNDNHILGRFKSAWNHFQSANTDLDLRQKLIKVVDPLLTDAHKVRRLIELGIYGSKSELRKVLDVVIKNICISRFYSYPIAYYVMHKPSMEYLEKINDILSISIEVLQEQLRAKKYQDVTFFEDSTKQAILNKLVDEVSKQVLLSNIIKSGTITVANTTTKL